MYSPQSTRAGVVSEEVLKPAMSLKGFLVGKFEVAKAPVSENAEKLARVLADGDIIVTAGGDGTTEVGVNAVLLSGKDVRLGALPYGNFNDVARMFGIREIAEILTAKVVKAYALECKVNGKHRQYAMGYFTVGMMADAARMLNRGVRRKHLRQNKNNTLFALNNAVRWFLKNRKRKFLPGVSLGGQKLGDMTEYMAVNSGTVAKIMKLEASYQKKDSLKSGIFNLKKFWKMARFGLRNVIFGIKLGETGGDRLEFEKPVKVVMQSEGECVELENVENMEFTKCARAIKVFKI